jgi:hypothetical protein
MAGGWRPLAFIGCAAALASAGGKSPAADLLLTPREVGATGWVTTVAAGVRNLPAPACELIAALDGVAIARLWVASETTHRLFLPPHMRTGPIGGDGGNLGGSLSGVGRLDVRLMCDGRLAAERSMDCHAPALGDEAMAALYSGRPLSTRCVPAAPDAIRQPVPATSAPGPAPSAPGPAPSAPGPAPSAPGPASVTAAPLMRTGSRPCSARC